MKRVYWSGKNSVWVELDYLDNDIIYFWQEYDGTTYDRYDCRNEHCSSHKVFYFLYHIIPFGRYVIT